MAGRMGWQHNSEMSEMLYSQLPKKFPCICALSAILALPVGEWLSLVEHLVRDQGVGGSNPLSPTNPKVPDFSITSTF